MRDCVVCGRPLDAPNACRYTHYFLAGRFDCRVSGFSAWVPGWAPYQHVGLIATFIVIVGTLAFCLGYYL